MNTTCRHLNRAGVLTMVWAMCALVVWPHDSDAAAVRLMLSSRADATSAGSDVYVVTYDSIDALIASPPTGSPVQGFSSIDIASTYIASGLAYDGKYRLMLSRRNDSTTAGNDVFVATYDTFDDLMASPPTGGPVQGFSSIDISGGYIASGLTYDGKYRLMLSKRNDSAAAGSDVFVATYDTFDDLMASPPAGGPVQAFSSIDIASGYIASGLTFDGKYRLMLSKRDDSVAAGSDVYVVTYDTFDDLIASPPTGGPVQAFSGVDISGLYIASGLAFEFDRDPGTGTVAEPTTAALTLAALALLAAASTRARRPAKQTPQRPGEFA